MTERRTVWVRGVAAFAAILLVLGLCGVIYVHNPRRGLPYHDQFNKGQISEWQQFGGTWSTVDGTIRNDSDERGSKLLTGFPTWKDYMVEADVKLLGRGDAGLVIRASDPDVGVDAYNGYYAGLRIDDQSLVLGRADYGWMEFPPVHMPSGVAPDHWYHLTLSAFRCIVKASATDPFTGKSAHTEVVDNDCAPSGEAGLRSVASGGAWRNVQIRVVKSAGTIQPHEPTEAALYPTSQGTYPKVHGIVQTNDGMRSSAALSASVQSISSVRLLAASRPITVTIRGIIVLTEPSAYIQDATGGAEVSFTKKASLKNGDEVEVTGDAYLHGLSLRIENATEREISGVVPAPALSITPLQAAMGRYDGMFVALEGKLDEKFGDTHRSGAYRLSGGQQAFYAIANTQEITDRLSHIKPGSLLRLHGICMLNQAFTQKQVPFALVIRSSDDVELLSGPPWWTVDHLAIMALGMLGIGFLIHLFYSHAQERRRAAILEERERLAYEMHDTLAQSFAGLDFQMRAIRNYLQLNSKKMDAARIRSEVARACDLVRHSHDEARRSLTALRPEILEKQGLSNALTQVARQMVAGNQMTVDVRVVGEPRPLPVRITDGCFRIGQEAIANAVRHSHARRLAIHFDYQRTSFLMAIEDNGRGFFENPDSDSFGLTGIRRRAKEINGELRIDTGNDGTRISVFVPSTR